MSDDLFDRSEFVSYFRDEAEELLQQIDADLLQLEGHVESGSVNSELVNSLFRALHTVKGSAGMLQFTEVQNLAHKLENLCDLLRKERIALSEACVNILFGGRDFLTDLIGAAIGESEPPSGLQDYTARLDSFVETSDGTASADAPAIATTSAEDDEAAAFEAEVHRLLEEAALAKQAAPQTVAPPPEPAAAPIVDLSARPEKAKPKRAVTHQTIRVDIDRLDLLLNLVGELVINRTRISDIAGTLERALTDKNGAASKLNGAAKDLVPLAKALADSSALLARTTNEIQESIMKVRMVPIGQVFERFPRLVRDVAKSRGKEVHLTI